MSSLQYIEIIEEVFNIYLERLFFDSSLKRRFWEEIVCKTESFIFGGVIVDYLNKNYDHRDIDFVVTSLSENHIEELQKFNLKKNSFGGYKIKLDNLNIDLWLLSNTWAIKRNNSLNFDLFRILPSTSFFNSTAIVYSIKDKKLYYKDSFVQSIENKKIDIVFEDNPFPELCIVKAYQYHTQKFKFSSRMEDYIVKYFNQKLPLLENIQIKHYGFVKYSVKELCDFYDIIKQNRKTEILTKLNSEFLNSQKQLQLF